MTAEAILEFAKEQLVRIAEHLPKDYNSDIARGRNFISDGLKRYTSDDPKGWHEDVKKGYEVLQPIAKKYQPLYDKPDDEEINREGMFGLSLDEVCRKLADLLDKDNNESCSFCDN